MFIRHMRVKGSGIPSDILDVLGILATFRGDGGA